jgi:Flp pilus assembly protein TadG
VSTGRAGAGPGVAARTRLRPAGRLSPRGRGERGQATVELALLLPVIATLVLLVVQSAMVARDQLLVTHAAREAARAAAVDPGVDVGAIVADRTGLPVVGARVTVAADAVRVDVDAEVEIHLPLLAALHPSVNLHASAVMRAEEG